MKFTIGIPAYKATYLKECIDSVLSQTYLDFELIIVNDSSPENIDDIISTYVSDKITYYKNDQNFGALNVVDNWNKCLSYAKGDFFILMGDDDKMDRLYLEEFAALIKRFPQCNLYHCRSVIINEDSIPLALTEPRPEFESVYDSILQRLKGNRDFFISDYVFRTVVLKNNGGFYKLPLAWASDDISSYIAGEKHGIAHTNKLLFMYRKNSQTISSTGNIYLKMDAILAEEKWLESFVKPLSLNFPENLLMKNIGEEIKKYIQKKKITTIYTSSNTKLVFLFFKWFSKRKKYGLSFDEIVYTMLMRIKENKKNIYNLATFSSIFSRNCINQKESDIIKR